MHCVRKLRSSFGLKKSKSNPRKTKNENDTKPQQQQDHKREASSSSTTTKVVIRHTTRQLPRPMHGFDNDMISLDKLMQRQNDKQFKAIGIVGTGGVGKTFICLHILNIDDVKKKLFPRVLVYMPRSNIENDESKQALAVVKGILVSLGVEIENKIMEDQSRSQKHELKALLYVLRRQLTGKRYLIVLDDVKEPNGWYGKLDSLTTFKGRDFPFPCGLPKGSGGTVIVTSRSEEVGKKMVGKENLHWLFPIPDPQELVLIYGDPNEEEERYDFHELRRNLDTLPNKLIDKCNGLPLAAKMMGKIKCEVAKRRAEEIKKKEKEAEQTPKETKQAVASVGQTKPKPILAQGGASKPSDHDKSAPAPAPAQGEASKPMEQAKPAPATAQGEASKPIKQTKVKPTRGQASKPIEQTKPDPVPTQGAVSKPIEQNKPEPAFPAQGEPSKPIEQTKEKPTPAQGEASKSMEETKHQPVPQETEQGEVSKAMKHTKPKPIPKQTEEVGVAKPIEPTKPEQVEASKPTPKQTEEVGAENPVEQDKSEQPQKETKQVQEESKHCEAAAARN